MWKRLITSFGLVAALAVSVPSLAEDYSYGDPWGGMYNTGGYNLFDFGLNLYDTSSYLNSNYGYDSSMYGGSCGSFYSSCSGGYDTAGLYGSDFGLSPYLYGSSSYSTGIDITININILSNLLYSMPYMSYPYGYGSGSQYGDIGCSVGYCSGGGSYGYDQPYMYPGFPYSGGSSYYGDYFGQNTYNYGIPGYNTIDINVYNPWQSYQPPVYTPPYNGCGVGSYLCPTGPVTRIDPPRYDPTYPPTYPPTTYPPTTYPIPPRVTPPTYTPPTYTPPTHTNPTPPTTQPPRFDPPVPTPGPTNEFVPTPPNRYRVPRG
jgi:hypothetical protein